MKKFLTSAIAAALVATSIGVFVACGDKEEGNKDAELAQKGLATIIDLTSKIDEETPQSYTVLGQTSAGGKSYNVKWSVSSEFPSYETYVSVGEKDATTKKVTINITKATEVVEYTLKATVTVGKASKSAEFQHKIPAGQAGENQVEKSLSFADKEQRTFQDSDSQIWEQNGIKLTNKKTPSSSPVADYANPARFYQGSTVKIEYPGMTKIIVNSYEKKGSDDYPGNWKSSLEAANLGTVTADAENNKVTLELTVPMNEIEFTAVKKIFAYSIDVVANKTAATDQDKVNGAKAALDLTDKKYGLAREYELPATQNGLAITWEVKEGGDYASITNDGKLKVNSLPQASTPVVLKATITSNAVTDTKDFTVTLVPLGITNDGTAEHPLTPSEAKLVTTTLLDEGATSSTEYYVKGFVIAPGTYSTQYKNFDDMYIADTADKATTDDAALYIFRPTPDGQKLTTDGFDKGDEVTFKGTLQHYVKDSTVTPELVGGVCVKRDVPDRTDDQIVELAKGNVNLAKTTYTTLDTTGVDLPATQNGASLEWEIEGGTSEYVSIEGGKLKVNKLPTSGDVTVTINVTISYGTATPQTKPINLTLKAPATAPVGTFKYGLAQETIGKKLYFNGTVNGSGFAETTESVSEAADVVVAATEGGYTIKVGEKFFELYTNDASKVRIKLSDTFTKAWVFDAELEVFTWTEGSKVYYVGSYSTFDTFSPSETKYITTAGNFAAKFEDPASKTDADKINDALAIVKSTLNNITEIGKVTLPASTVDGVTFVWTLATDNAATCATVIQEDGAYKLNVTELPEDADATVKLVVTASCGDATDKTKSVTVVVEKPADVNYGDIDNPLSVTEALALAADQCPNTNNFTKQVVYMTGKVTSTPNYTGSYYQSFYLEDLTDSTQTIQVYSISLADGVDFDSIAQNDVLTIYGYVKRQNKTTLQFSTNSGTYVYAARNVRGTSTITLDIMLDNDVATATVTGLEATQTKTNGTEVTFTVAAADGKEITVVSVGGNKIDPTETNGNSYKFTVAGDTTVRIETKNLGAVDNPTATITYSTKGYANQDPMDGVEVKDDDNVISVTFDKKGAQNGPAYYTTGTGVRYYPGNKITVSVPSGYEIVKITFTWTNGTNTITVNEGTLNSNVWTGNASSVEFTSEGTSGHYRVQAIEVEYKATTPTPAGGDEGGEEVATSLEALPADEQ